MNRTALIASCLMGAAALAGIGAALAQGVTISMPAGATTTVTTNAGTTAESGAAQPAKVLPPDSAPTANGPMTLVMRGLDKITGRPTNIIAPLGKPVQFATLTITARYCYSTPASETPETAAFVQIEDHRPDQSERRVFSGWMYGSSPGLNGMEHPLYDVWVITCKGGATPGAPPVIASTAPVKVLAPDSSDKEGIVALPDEAGR